LSCQNLGQKKLQMTITFDRELELKMKVAQNGIMNVVTNIRRELGFKIFQNSIIYYYFSIYLVFLSYFFYILDLFRISILVRKFWKFLWYFLVWIRDFTTRTFLKMRLINQL